MNKLNRILLTINGLIIPIFIAVIIYYSFLKSENTFEETESIIIGEKLEKAKSDSMALQGIIYETPEVIYNSTNFYLPISVMTYEEAKDLSAAASSAGDMNIASLFNYYNVIFLDKNYKVIGQLLDKKGSISDIHINRGQQHNEDDLIDKTVKNIGYLIGFIDTNGDGNLNNDDDHDLYISNLDGKNLTQVTTKKEIIDYKFINQNSEIFIRFKDRNNTRDEYKRTKFGVYNISKGLLNELTDIENKLTEIESELIK